MAANSEKTAKKRRGLGRPFKSGQSGNPSGRPKNRPYIDEIKAFLDAGDGARFRNLLNNLLENKPEILLYYVAGKPTENVNHSGSLVVGLPDDVLERAREYAKARKG